MDNHDLFPNDGQIPCSSCGAITFFISRKELCLKCITEKQQKNERIQDILMKDSSVTHLFTIHENRVLCLCNESTCFTYNDQCVKCVMEQHPEIIEIIDREFTKKINEYILEIIEKDKNGKSILNYSENFKDCSCGNSSQYFFNEKCPHCLINDDDPVIDEIEKNYKNYFLKDILLKDQCCQKIFKVHDSTVSCQCGRNTSFTYEEKCAACIWENEPDIIDNIETQFMTLYLSESNI